MQSQEIFALIFVSTLFVGMLVCLEYGRVLGRKRAEPGGKEGLSVIEGAIFALLGLLIAFTFSGAAERFENRRHMIVEEANDIGTAYLRVDLLPVDTQPEIRDLFRRYVDSRIETYRIAADDWKEALQHFAKSQALQNELWQKSVAAAARSGNTTASMLLLPALNEMIDITTTRLAATEDHPPMIIFALLTLIALVTSMMAGFEMAPGTRRVWLHIIGYSLIMAISVYVILDLEFPRLGLIRVDSFDKYIVEVRNAMK